MLKICFILPSLEKNNARFGFVFFFSQNIHHLGLPSVLARGRDVTIWPYPSGMYVLFNGL